MKDIVWSIISPVLTGAIFKKSLKYHMQSFNFVGNASHECDLEISFFLKSISLRF